MKHKIFLLAILALTLTFMGAGSAQAQATAPGSVTVTVTISPIAELTLTGTSISFPNTTRPESDLDRCGYHGCHGECEDRGGRHARRYGRC